MPDHPPVPAATPAEEEARKIRRVAVVVFLECEGWDDRDAATGATLAVRQNLSDRGMRLPEVITGKRASGEFQARVHMVMPLDDAAGNYYLRLSPTRKGFHDV